MSKSRFPLLLFLMFSLVLAPDPCQAGSARQVDSSHAQWTSKMRKLYRTLAELLTDLSSDHRFEAKQNRKRIEKNALELSRLAHDLKSPGVNPPDRDPSVRILGGLFSDEAERAYRLLRTGKPPQMAYAREVLQSIPGYCIACHTRTGTGPSFASLPLNPTVGHLKTIEKARFYAATRQFDRALDEFGKIVSEPGAASEHFAEWQESVKNSLAIAIRVKQSPDLAMGVVEKVLQAPDVPFFLKQDAVSWKASIVEWKKEGKKDLSTDEALHAEAVRLLTRAHEVQKYPADHGADVIYLRASAVVHSLLQRGKDARYTHEAYLMAGLCYEVLRSFHLGELHEIYFETCIRLSPHTPLARTCFRRYQQSIYNGFTGSAGTDIPIDVERKMKVLESLAFPLSTPKRALE